jgi:hypothetical protein
VISCLKLQLGSISTIGRDQLKRIFQSLDT